MISVTEIGNIKSGNWPINATMGIFDAQLRHESRGNSQRELYAQLLETERVSQVPEINSKIKELEHIYKFSNFNDIREFIKRHNYILDSLFEGEIRINQIFGNDVEKYLEITTDPEESYRELFIVIKSKLNPRKARKLMDRLDNEWFISQLNKTKGKLCITEEPL